MLTGRGWLGTDEFTFTITPQDGAPAAEDAAADGTKTVTVTSDSAKAGEAVLFGFGKIRFTDEDMNGSCRRTGWNKDERIPLHSERKSASGWKDDGSDDRRT